MARKKMNILVLISYTIIVSCAVDIVDQTPIKIYNYISEPNFVRQILCIHRFNDIFKKKKHSYKNLLIPSNVCTRRTRNKL